MPKLTIMQIKFVPVVLAIVLFFASTFSVMANLTVGVKTGDWIEYSVSSTGAPIDGHDVTWARMEITDVQATNISIIVTSHFSNNNTDTVNSVLDFQTGHLIDDFIIPANLNVGDIFLDEKIGNVTITSVETRRYAKADRTVLSSTVFNNTYFWDQATGVSLEGKTQTDTYTIHTIAKDTNLWQPQSISSPSYDFTSIVLVIAFGAIVLAVALMATARYIKRKASQMRKLLNIEGL
jgi:hypothetical protein